MKYTLEIIAGCDGEKIDTIGTYNTLKEAMAVGTLLSIPYYSAVPTKNKEEWIVINENDHIYYPP